MSKTLSEINNLKMAFLVSLKMARRVTQREHRANPFLNITNMTTKSAIQYPDLTGEKPFFSRLATSFIGAFGTITRAVLYWPIAIRLKHSTTNPDVVIISHLIAPEHLTASEDFYFGSLDQDLENAGYKTHTILINHCRATSKNIKNNLRQHVTILPAFFNPWQELKAIIRLLISVMTIPKLNDHPSFRRKVQWAQLCSRAIGDYRIGLMVGEIITNFQPRAIIHTYEGHGWERVLQADCHQMKKPPVIIGYQHAVLFPGLKSICYHHGNGADPDHIFTLGKITRDQLIKEGDFDKISVLGSPKNFKMRPSAKFKGKGNCLIAPEGSISEVMIMTKFAINAAHLNPNQRFVLRLHPVLKRADVTRKLKRFDPFPDNFSISKADLELDFNAASWLCYRGSTMAVQGILYGLRPIYLDPDNMAATNDPIPRDLAFHRIATNEQELVSIIQLDQQPSAVKNKELQSARRFALDYITPMRPDRLINYLKTELS